MNVIEVAPATFDWVNPASTLIAVIIGAALTYFITHWFERGRLRDERLGRSYTLFFAILKISDDLTKMELDLREAVAKAEAAGVKGELWTKLTTSIGYSETIAIDPRDLALVALTGDTAFTMQVGEAESAHRIFTETARRLEELRNTFASFGLQTGIEGETVSFEADETQLARIGPTLIQLRSLSNSYAQGLPEAAAQARAVAEKLGPHLKKHYKFKRFNSMSFPQPLATPDVTETEASVETPPC